MLDGNIPRFPWSPPPHAVTRAHPHHSRIEVDRNAHVRSSTPTERPKGAEELSRNPVTDPAPLAGFVTGLTALLNQRLGDRIPWPA